MRGLMTGVLLALLLAATAPALAEKRVALVMGIDAYDNLPAHTQLQKARADANAVGDTLKALGFEVVRAENATRSQFNSLWGDFLSKLNRGDTAALFFAGHAVELSGRNYLLPRDVPNIRLGREEVLKRESLSLPEFLTDLQERGTRVNIVILDACRDNPFAQVGGRSVGGQRGLVMSEPPEGTFIMFSAGAGESALDRLSDSDTERNSVFTRRLLPLLREPGISLTDVAERVRLEVRTLAGTVQHKQTPAYYNSVLGRLCLSGTCRSDGTPPVSPGLIEAERSWGAVRDSKSIAALGAFAARYPDTFYSDLAIARMEELRRAEAAANQSERQRVAMLEQQRAEAARRAAEAEATRKQPAEPPRPSLQEMQAPIDNLFAAWNALDLSLYTDQWAPQAVKVDLKSKTRESRSQLIASRRNLFASMSSVSARHTARLKSFSNGVATFAVSYSMTFRRANGRNFSESACENYRIENVGGQWLIVFNEDYAPCS